MTVRNDSETTALSPLHKMSSRTVVCFGCAWARKSVETTCFWTYIVFIVSWKYLLKQRSLHFSKSATFNLQLRLHCSEMLPCIPLQTLEYQLLTFLGLCHDVFAVRTYPPGRRTNPLETCRTIFYCFYINVFLYSEVKFIRSSTLTLNYCQCFSTNNVSKWTKPTSFASTLKLRLIAQ